MFLRPAHTAHHDFPKEAERCCAGAIYGNAQSGKSCARRPRGGGGASEIAVEAEAAVFHRQLFEELFRLSASSRHPAEAMAVGAVEASFKCLAKALIVLTESGRSAHLVSRYRPRAPIIAVTRNGQTARQAHLYRGIFPVLYKEPVHQAWAEDVDLRVNFAMDIGKARGFFKTGDCVIVLTGWQPGSGFTNTMRVVPVP